MDSIRAFVERVVEETGAYPVIIFGSALHGSGRSFLADMTYKKIVAAGYPAERVSTGRIFREIAEENGMSIDGFMKLQTEDPQRFYTLNISVDARIHEIMSERSVDNVLVIDSNLAAYHAEGPNAYALLVYCRPEVVGQRVFSARREGDEPYNSPEDALNSMIERTMADIEVYKAISDIVRDNFWKMVYRIAAKDLQKNLSDVLSGKIPESPFFHTTVDNSGNPERSWEQIEKWVGAQR